MKQIIAQNGDRLDQIVYEQYKTLSVMDKVLEANTHLKNKVILVDGDVINIPVITIAKETIKKVKTLW
ncbi:tail protein X [Aliarcobacter butzleri]|uniref:tail protein X n=1 Tax=Aliarcobacter butzleri TaxID=28197 RepID=UPI003AFB6BB5